MAISTPNKVVYTYLSDGESEEMDLTFGALDGKARKLAGRLQAKGARGERALLLYPPGLDFVVSFFGCLYAGVVAVPVYPPRSNQNLARLEAIVADAEAAFVLTTSFLHSTIEQKLQLSRSICFMVTDLLDDVNIGYEEILPGPRDLAFLQYTSGSTGTPKGVMVEHGNLLQNLEIIESKFGMNAESVSIIWLPQYHDMGLVGGLLTPVYSSYPCVLMAPAMFLQKPFRWLQAVSRYRGTISGGPNFAYDLCANRITPQQMQSLDLSSWQVAFNGAEPVRAETLDRFAATFASCGFRRKAFYPCYGIAEATLFVTGGLPGEGAVVQQGDRTTLTQHQSETAAGGRGKVVSCGMPGRAHEVVVADPEQRTVKALGEVGEIWVSGPSIARGYWKRPEETMKTFHAYLAGGKGPFLRTGDLGFQIGEELFVTGRIKDLIIIHGRNHYPQDLEQTVEECHPSLRRGGGAAFSVQVKGEECLVVVQELERKYLRQFDTDEVVGTIRKAVLEEHDLQVHAVLLLKTASIPKTSSGKIQRHACKAGFLSGTLEWVAQWRQEEPLPATPVAVPPTASLNPTATEKAIREWLVLHIAEWLQLSPEKIDTREVLASYGLDSVTAVRLSGELEESLGRKISPTLVYDYPTIEALARHLAATPKSTLQSLAVPVAPPVEEPIAIVGISCRFPEAKNLEEFWRVVSGGIDAIGEVPSDRWNFDLLRSPEPGVPGKMNIRWGGFIKEVDGFDPQFFGISPREAEAMDPQQRLLLEVSWEALELAGQAPEKLAGSQTGVFVGISNYDYGRMQLALETSLNIYAGTGNALSIAANRLSYVLNLHGPSLAIDTACSSSLVAIHLACRSLSSGESSMALAAGVNLILAPEPTIIFSQARMLASDGRCKTFDAAADGYVRGEGCGVVVLKRLSDALANHDQIWAVIRGSAINQDGRTNGLTAPNGLAQQAVIRQALARAGVAPAWISYLEAHGTGTSLGDPIEVNALKEVFLEGRAPDEYCGIGSVKTNIGHLEAAAGIAGLIKVALCLRHRTIAPHLHLRELNPHIDLEGTPFFIPGEKREWRNTRPLLAGVSSFGFGGTNAHVILQEPPDPVPAPAGSDLERPLHLFTLSAPSAPALRELVHRFHEYLAERPVLSLADLCFTANTGRSQFEHRLAAVTTSLSELRDQLEAFQVGRTAPGLFSGEARHDTAPQLAFLFSGQGSQYLHMGRELYDREPRFRATLEHCDELLYPYLGTSLIGLLYPPEPHSLLDETRYTQPALFALEYALAELWKSWGVEPTVVMGHSVGEYVAAARGGVFSLEDGLKLIAERARLMDALPREGEMVSVFGERRRVETALEPYSEDLTIAAFNGPEQTVVSGRSSAIRAVTAALTADGIMVRSLTVSHGFHSPLMRPILPGFESIVQQIQLNQPRLPLVSNLTGAVLRDGEMTPEYWSRHILEPVCFEESIGTIAKLGCRLFLEIGPKGTLCALARQFLPQKNLLLPSWSGEGRDTWFTLLTSLAQLFLHGVPVDFDAFHTALPRRRLALPTTPFLRQRYWTRTSSTPVASLTQSNHPLLGCRLQLPVPVFEVWLSTLVHNYFEDHKVHGVPVLPASAYVEMALCAAREFSDGQPFLLQEVQFHQALSLDQGKNLRIHTVLSRTGTNCSRFEIFSLSEEGAGWDLHASGAIVAADSNCAATSELSLVEIQKRLTEPVATDGFYHRLSENGLQYGSSFRGIEQLWSQGGEALALVANDANGVATDSYLFHPAVLDACFQVVAATVSADAGTGVVYLPTGLGSLNLYRKPESRLWSYSCFKPDSEAGKVEADIAVWDETGQPVLELVGFQVKALGDHKPEWLLHEVHWRLQEEISELVELPKGDWLILADCRGVGSALADLLKGTGERCVTVSAGVEPLDLSAREFVVDPLHPEGLKAVLAQGGPWKGLVYLWGLDAPEAGELTAVALETESIAACSSLLRVLQLLNGTPRAPRLWVVTAGAQRVQSEPLFSLAQAPLWGLGRVVASEQFGNWGGLIDLEPTSTPESSAQDLLDVLLKPGQGDFAYRGGRRYRFEVVPRRFAREEVPFTLRSDGAYLITGGLGDLGLVVAKWMVQKGARRILLVGRTSIPSRSEWNQVTDSKMARRIAAIWELEALGATVRYAAVNMADEASLYTLLENYTEEVSPIRGVIHTAGVLEDATLGQLDQAKLEKVFLPKIQGGWNLHRFFARTPLDIFVLFSSAAALYGPPGQGNYAAANAFLDALAQYRKGLGLSAISLNWGPWAHIGMAAQGAGTRLEHFGVRSLTPEVALQALEQALQQESPQLAILALDHARWKALNRDREEAGRGAEQKGRERILAAHEAERPELLAEGIRQVVAHTLRLPPSALSMERQLTTMGVDSIVALEIKNRIETEYGVFLPLINLLQGTSVRDLAGRILTQLVDHASGEAAVPLCAAERPLRYPLSYGQRAMWFLYQVAPDSPAYNLGEAVLVKGNLDPKALTWAYQELVRRHDALRTVILMEDGKLLQQVQEQGEAAIHFQDLSAIPEGVLPRYLAEEIDRPFDLYHGPLARIAVFTLGEGRSVFVLAMHHIIGELWAIIVLIDELLQLYFAYHDGRPSTLPQIATYYSEYIAWQTQFLTGAEGAQCWEYWEKELGGELPVLNLSTDRPRPAVKTFSGAQYYFQVGAAVTDKLREIANTGGVTLYSVLMAAFATLLYRYTSQEEIIIGSPMTGRSLAEWVRVVGFFDNTVPIRVRLNGDQSFTEVVAQLRETVLGAMMHKDYPFPLLVEKLQLPRDASRSPLFDVMFVLRKSHLPEEQQLTAFALGKSGMAVRHGDLTIESLSIPRRMSQFDLTLAMAEVDSELHASFEYNSDLFDEPTVARFSAHLQVLLKGIACAPETKLDALPLLTSGELDQVFLSWNDTEGLVNDILLQELFETQAYANPELKAVISPSRVLNYAQLMESSNRLGNHLRGKGARPNTLIAVTLAPGWEQMVAVLGVLKAGAAYLPVDPKLPMERICYLLRHSEVELVLTTPDFDRALAWPEEVERILLTEIELIQWNPSPLTPCQQPEDLAYVIFTSGSTGTPKGVMIDHRGAVNTILDMNDRFDVTQDDRVLALSSLSFDLSVYDIFGILGAGGALVLPDPRRTQDPLHWAELVVKEGVTLWNTVPALFKLYVEYLGSRPDLVPASLRIALMSGDWIPLFLPQDAWELMPELELISLGGATEASIWSICHPITEVLPQWKSIPYGRPLANQRMYVLNEALSPCPIGVTGKIFIGGIGVAKGYLRDEEKTRASFLVHPTSGERLYRTGDLGCYFANGEIEFLGRQDNQVKIRGFRVELGEIEAILSLHPAVREALVLVREDTPGPKRLVAYLVCAQDGAPTADELARLTETKLPAYMVPAAFVFLEAWPLSSNGKVERTALPVPVAAEWDGYLPPRNQAEETLASIWEEVLELERVGINDDFFALGGDSILGIRVVIRANQAGLRFTPLQLFENPTVAALAGVARAVGTIAAEQGAVTGPVAVTPHLLRFLHQPQPHGRGILLELNEPLELFHLERALRCLPEHHDALRLTRQGDLWSLGNVVEPTAAQLLVLDLSAFPQEKRVAVLEQEAVSLIGSLDLGSGPLLLGEYFDCGNGVPDYLFLAAQELVVDSSSWHLLLEDLRTLYLQFLRGETPQLPEKTISFRSWSERLREFAKGSELHRELSYWSTFPLQRSALPVDQLEPDGSALRCLTLVLDRDETRALKDASSSFRVGFDELLLAGLVRTVISWSGTEQLLVEVAREGRECLADLDLSRTVGCFTTRFPLLFEWGGECAGEALRSVKEQLRRVPNGGLGFGLMCYLGDDGSRKLLKRIPLPQLRFQYLGEWDQIRNRSWFSLPKGPEWPSSSEPGCLLKFEGWINEGRLGVNWHYGAAYRDETIKALAQGHLETLRELIAEYRNRDLDPLAPSDFPLAQLDHAALVRLQERYRCIDDIYPLSPMQQGMLFHSLSDVVSGLYCEQVICNLNGELEVEPFRRAWREILARHSILRTAFVWEGMTEPLQVVLDQVPLVPRLHDWRGVGAEEEGSRLQGLLDSQRHAGFDLGEPPLLYLDLIRGPLGSRFVMTFHHLLLDGWSLALLLDELKHRYDVYRVGSDLNLPSAHNYRDYIGWLKTRDLAEAERFWRDTLKGFRSATIFPGDRQLSTLKPGESPYGETMTRLPVAQTEALKEFTKRNGLTINTVVQGAWAFLLSRFSRETDVVFGVTVSGRPTELAGVADMTGLFINTLPVRVRLTSDDALVPWLLELQGINLRLRQYEFSHLMQIQRWSELPAGQPLFESILVFENYPGEVGSGTGEGRWQLEVRALQLTNYPIHIMATPGAELVLHITYDKRRYGLATMDRVLRHLQTIIEGMAEE